MSTTSRLKKKFVRQEMKYMTKRILKIRAIVDTVLKEDFGRRLYRLKHDDEVRLLTLYTWRDRYRVPIKWMLRILIPIWTKTFSRFRTNSSLGCRVATLIGKKSEEILQERIYKEYRHGENKDKWRQSERERITHLVNGDRVETERHVKFNSILEAPTPEAYLKQYKRELKWKKSGIKLSSHSQKHLNTIKKKRYRNNPWQM